MAYTDNQGMTSGRLWSIIIVAIIHLIIGYAFVTGLAYNVITQVQKDLKTFDVKDEPPPPEEELPPPPPPDSELPPPPVVTPPPIVRTQPTVQPVIIASPTPAPVITIVPPAPPPPPPPVVSRAAGPKGDPGRWFSSDDYPPAALRAEASGVTAISWEINTEGRAENCVVTSSSGNSDLDRTTCSLITRRGRYTPALDQSGNPIRSRSSRRVRWELPKN